MYACNKQTMILFLPLFFTPCHGLNIFGFFWTECLCPSKFTCEALTPSAMVFGAEALGGQ